MHLAWYNIWKMYRTGYMTSAINQSYWGRICSNDNGFSCEARLEMSGGKSLPSSQPPNTRGGGAQPNKNCAKNGASVICMVIYVHV